MEKIQIWAYEILLTGKKEGSSYDVNHWVHDTYYSIKQVHEDRIIEYYGEAWTWDQSSTGDAIITKISPLGVHTADCLPLALLWSAYYAIVHGSWKTLHAWLLQHTVKKLCRQGEGLVDMYVYIWPSIRKASYEVGKEFRAYFPSRVLEEREWKLFLDMVGYAIGVLIQLWVPSTNIQVHPDCTYTKNDTWWSWRRGDTQGRNFMWVRRI